MIACFLLSQLKAQDTFSIVAIDTVTGEVGSAGASCIGVVMPFAPHGAQVISDVIPGLGAVHTQAQYLAANQQNAHTHMLAGDSAQQIISWLTFNDAQGNATIRQYGIVRFKSNGSAESAAFTGNNCMNYKNHITGPNYSIQGNILLGQQILDSMEARFINATGTLADKLMAALQGANVVGADTRCASSNTSSLSSFIRVAQPTDSIGSYYLDLYMSYPNTTGTIYAVDPIDSLQTLYNIWQTSAGINNMSLDNKLVKVFRKSDSIIFDLSLMPNLQHLSIKIFDLSSREIFKTKVNSELTEWKPFSQKSNNQLYLYQILKDKEIVANGKFIY